MLQVPFKIWRRAFLSSVLLFTLSSAVSISGEPPKLPADVRGFVEKHCLMCHGAENPKAGLALHHDTEEKSLLKGRKKWELVLDMVEAAEMPPKEKPQPTADERTAFLNSVRGIYERLE